ncbi:MAG: hypothetical protein PSU94_04850 [Lacunisphaera sp.]|nr:hypothetical protein [Lacunisphaera sp.]
METLPCPASARPASPAISAAPARPAPRRRRQDAGFTIIEVAMASFVMAFGIATSIITMQSGFKQIDLARGTTLAGQIMQSEVERLRMMSYAQIFAMSSAAGTPSGQPAGTAVFDGGTYFSTSSDVVGKYAITRTIAPDSTRPTEVMNIRVQVRWRSYDGRWHQRSLDAIYAKNGLYDYYYTVAHP